MSSALHSRLEDDALDASEYAITSRKQVLTQFDYIKIRKQIHPQEYVFTVSKLYHKITLNEDIHTYAT